MKNVIALLAACALFSGCTAKPPVYSWYHPIGGEYLFTYDHDQCVDKLAESGLVPGTDVNGPFFHCMQSRGHSLISAARDVPGLEQAGIK